MCVACGVCTVSPWPTSKVSHSCGGKLYTGSGAFSVSCFKLELESCQIQIWGFSHTTGACSQPAHASWKHKGVNCTGNNFQSVREGDRGYHLTSEYFGGLLYTPQRFQQNPALYLQTSLKETHPSLGFSYFPDSLFQFHTDSITSLPQALLSEQPVPGTMMVWLCLQDCVS